MNTTVLIISVLVMAGVTYLIRMLPMVLCKNQLQNRFIRSFLAYVPYAVLSAMTFPQILSSAGGLPASIAGMTVALILAYCKKGLLVVALGATAAAFIAQQLLAVIS